MHVEILCPHNLFWYKTKCQGSHVCNHSKNRAADMVQSFSAMTVIAAELADKDSLKRAAPAGDHILTSASQCTAAPAQLQAVSISSERGNADAAFLQQLLCCPITQVS